MEALSSLFVSLSLFISGLLGGGSSTQIPEMPLPKRVHHEVVTSSVPNVLKEITASSTIENSSSSSTLLYRNKKYNFTLTFPKSWEGYRIKETSPNNFSFGLKDQDTIFSIVVMSKKEWQTLVDENEKFNSLIPEKLAEDDNKHVFAYSHSQDATDTVYPFLKDLKSIKSTFTLQNEGKESMFKTFTGEQRESVTTLVGSDLEATIEKDFNDIYALGPTIIYTTKNKSKTYFALYGETEGHECVTLDYLDAKDFRYYNTTFDFCPWHDYGVALKTLPFILELSKVNTKTLYMLDLEEGREKVAYLLKDKSESLVSACLVNNYFFDYVSDVEVMNTKKVRIGVYKEEGQGTDKCLKERKYTKIRDDYIDLTKFQ